MQIEVHPKTVIMLTNTCLSGPKTKTVLVLHFLKIFLKHSVKCHINLSFSTNFLNKVHIFAFYPWFHDLIPVIFLCFAILTFCILKIPDSLSISAQNSLNYKRRFLINRWWQEIASKKNYSYIYLYIDIYLLDNILNKNLACKKRF